MHRTAGQAGDYVVERDRLSGAVGPFHPKEDLGRGGIVVDGDVERALIGNTDFLSDVIATRGEGETSAHDSSPSV